MSQKNLKNLPSISKDFQPEGELEKYLIEKRDFALDKNNDPQHRMAAAIKVSIRLDKDDERAFCNMIADQIADTPSAKAKPYPISSRS